MTLFDWFRRLTGAGRDIAKPGPGADHATPPQSAPRTQEAKALTPQMLDLGVFAPLREDEVRSAAAMLNARAQDPLFGRRDLIPPSQDPRTALIDRGMVGLGIVTPEELAELHALGDRMAELRPNLALAHLAAAAAVSARIEERKARKATRQAAAQERAHARATAVARRRAEDIVFLGRGVSRGLAVRSSAREKLAAFALPYLATPAELAAALGLGVPRLRWLAFHAEAPRSSLYVRFQIPKKSGGVRTLARPNRTLAKAQAWILEHILNKLPAHAAAHGFVKGRSTVTNAAPHVGQALVVNLDLEGFFPAITFPRVRGLFQELGYSPAVATVLALLVTEAPRREVFYAGERRFVATGPRELPQGAATSPAISNLIMRRFDARLTGLARRLGWSTTRYADDITCSSPDASQAKVGYLLGRIRHIAQDEGFKVNEAKTRIQRRSQAQLVTGVVVNERTGAPRHLLRRLRAILHRARAEGLAAQNRAGHPNFEAWVRGMVAYVTMLNPSQGLPLQGALAAVLEKHG